MCVRGLGETMRNRRQKVEMLYTHSGETLKINEKGMNIVGDSTEQESTVVCTSQIMLCMCEFSERTCGLIVLPHWYI